MILFTGQEYEATVNYSRYGSRSKEWNGDTFCRLLQGIWPELGCKSLLQHPLGNLSRPELINSAQIT
jgi:hypothetical protein